MPTYNKLVRDKILEIIEANGLQYNARVLEAEELIKEVKAKMVEEALEFEKAADKKEAIEELADILELVHAAINSLGIRYEQLEEVRHQKKEKRGGFDQAIYLIDVEGE